MPFIHLEGETALFVSPSDGKALAGAIQKITTNKDLALKLSENAYKEVKNNYTWKKRAENILNFIKK